MADTGDIPPGTLEALDIALGLPPGTIRALLEAGLAIFDFLFGGGHAGSCGAFRDEYFSVANALNPLMNRATDLWEIAGINYTPLPTEIMVAFGPALKDVIETADHQFDQFKGSNLLGQTMFCSRIHLYLFERWVANTLFGSAQWSQHRVNYLTDVDLKHEGYFGQISQSLAGITAQLNTLGQDHNALNTTIGVVLDSYRILTEIVNVHIPNLIKSDQAILNFLTSYVNPQIANLLTVVTGITQQALPNIIQTVHLIQQDVISATQPLPVQQTLQNHNQRLAQLEQQKVTQILPAIQALRDALGLLSQDLELNIKPQISILSLQMVDIFSDLNVTIRPTIKVLREQIPTWPARIQTPPLPETGVFFRIPWETLHVYDAVIQSA